MGASLRVRGEGRKGGEYVPGLGGLHARMRLVLGEITCAELGRRTGTHPETVRRYRAGQMPSLEFVAALCRELNVSADWLLSGQGEQAAAGCLGSSDGLAAALDDLAEKVRSQGVEALSGPQGGWPRLAGADSLVVLPAWATKGSAVEV